MLNSYVCCHCGVHGVRLWRSYTVSTWLTCLYCIPQGTKVHQQAVIAEDLKALDYVPAIQNPRDGEFCCYWANGEPYWGYPTGLSIYEAKVAWEALPLRRIKHWTHFIKNPIL